MGQAPQGLVSLLAGALQACQQLLLVPLLPLKGRISAMCSTTCLMQRMCSSSSSMQQLVLLRATGVQLGTQPAWMRYLITS